MHAHCEKGMEESILATQRFRYEGVVFSILSFLVSISLWESISV